MNEKREKIILRVLWIITALVCIKSIFTDFGADSAYQVAMSYRHLSGDGMLLKMWEPHQTSIFLNDVLMAVYHFVVPSYAGVVLYLQVCGTLLFGLLGWFVYRTVKETTGAFVGQAIWMFLLVFRAKQTPFPEFANLEIACSVLIFCLLLRFLGAQDRWIYPVLIGVCAFFQVLSYPSCVLIAVPVCLLLFLKTNAKWKNILLFLGTAGVLGVTFLASFFVRLGSDTFLLAVRNIFLSDTHSTSGDYWNGKGGYWMSFFVMLGVVALCALVAWGILSIVQRFRGSKTGAKEELLGGADGQRATSQGSVEAADGQPAAGTAFEISVGTLSVALLIVVELVCLALQRRLSLDWNCSIYVLPLILLVLGAIGYRKASEEERTIFLTGALVSAASFFATMLLTDLSLITITAYLVLGGAASLLMLRRLFKDDKRVILLLLLLVLAHRGLVVWGIGNTNDRVHTLWEVQNIIRSGPAAGVVCDHVSKAQALWTIEDFALYVKPEDKLLVVGPEMIDPLVYLYAGAEISNYSTIDTPQYGEALEEYFALNPDKEPTLVAVSSWFGTPNVTDDTYIMQWVNARYELSVDARYFRLYRKKAE